MFAAKSLGFVRELGGTYCWNTPGDISRPLPHFGQCQLPIPGQSGSGV